MNEKFNSKLWAINNVDNRAKDKAKKLARENKKKIGPWLTDLILNGESNSNSDKILMKILEQSLGDIHLRMDALNKKIDMIDEKLKLLMTKNVLSNKKSFFGRMW